MPRLLSLSRTERGVTARPVKSWLTEADAFRELFGLGDNGAPRLSPAKAFAVQGYVRRCVLLRARAAASVPFSLYRDGEEEPVFTEADEPPPEYAALTSLHRTRWDAEASLALSGAAYFVILREARGGRRISAASPLGRFLGLQFCAIGTVTPKASPAGIEAFHRTVNGQQIPYPADAMLHVFQPDPFRDLGPGGSDAHAASLSASALLSYDEFVSDHLGSGLLKATVLMDKTGEAAGRLDPEDQNRLKDGWWDFLSRKRQTRRPPIVSGFEPHTLGDGLADLDNEALTEGQIKAICAAFGVPDPKILGGANYAESSIHERAFLLETVFPQARLFADAINAQLLSGYGLRLVLAPERHEVMQQYELETAQTVKDLTGRPVLSLNEGRIILGKPPVEGGDEIAPASGPGTSVVVNTSGSGSGSGSEGGPASVEDDGPAASSPTASGPTTGGDGATRSLPPEIMPVFYYAAGDHPPARAERKAADWKAQTWAATDALKTEGIRPLRRAAEDFLRALVDALADAISGEGDAIAALLSFDLGAWADRLPDAFRAGVLRALRAGWNRGAFNVDRVMPWDAEDARIVAVADRLIRAASGVPETVRAQAETAIRAAIEEGLDRDEMVAALRDALSDLPETNAARIAETTGTGAFEAGQMTAYAEAGVTHVMWLSQRDNRVRDSHGSVDGEEVPVGTPFSNGLMYPGDPDGPVGEIARCRCTTLGVMRDLEESFQRSVSRRTAPVETAPVETWTDRRNAHIRARYRAPEIRSLGSQGVRAQAVHDEGFEGEPYDIAVSTLLDIARRKP